MTDDEFDQVLHDIAALSAEHPEADLISLPPELADEFERRGAHVTRETWSQ